MTKPNAPAAVDRYVGRGHQHQQKPIWFVYRESNYIATAGFFSKRTNKKTNKNQSVSAIGRVQLDFSAAPAWAATSASEKRCNFLPRCSWSNEC